MTNEFVAKVWSAFPCKNKIEEPPEFTEKGLLYSRILFKAELSRFSRCYHPYFERKPALKSHPINCSGIVFHDVASFGQGRDTCNAQ
jgi:hypothetical protein